MRLDAAAATRTVAFGGQLWGLLQPCLFKSNARQLTVGGELSVRQDDARVIITGIILMKLTVDM